jgi:hypothetical protein
MSRRRTGVAILVAGRAALAAAEPSLGQDVHFGSFGDHLSMQSGRQV